MQKPPNKPPNRSFQKLSERASSLLKLAIDYKNNQNIGMAIHLIATACEALLEGRDSVSAQERTQRENMARMMLQKGKTQNFKFF
jgi:hypothetical protein